MCFNRIVEKMYILFSNCFQWAFCLSNLISRKKAPHYLQICISAHPDIMLICSLHSAQCAHTAHPVHAHLHICIYSFERCSVYVYVCVVGEYVCIGVCECVFTCHLICSILTFIRMGMPRKRRNFGQMISTSECLIQYKTKLLLMHIILYE